VNPLLAALVAAGVIDQATAERLNRQMDSEAARAWAEATLERANIGALAGQQERLIGLLRGNDYNPTEAQWRQFWHDEDARMWADLSDSYRDVASERAAARAIVTAQSWSTWELLNRNVDEWVNTYYTSPDLAAVGSVPNLCDTARQEVADAFLRWTRGGRDLAPGADGGLPVLIAQLEPTFGPARAKRIAVTETTRIFVEGNRSVNDANPVITGYQVLTAADERVCPICGSLHGVFRNKASRTYQHPTMGAIAGPPFHVNCRCDEIEATSQTQGIALNSPWQYEGEPA
jgi:SPP1 gp7 family putative phage head morphogenesis protein